MDTMSENRFFSIPTVRLPPPSSPHSPLRSPKRRPYRIPIDEDPLLGKLSPEAILDALASVHSVTRQEAHAQDLLVISILQAPVEDRILGARAAVAGQRIREWLDELQAWPWPSGYGARQGQGFMPPSNSMEQGEPDFFGSLSTRSVVEYENRIEQIRDGIEGLNVEELKEHIINVHVPGRSRPSSSHSAISAMSAPPFAKVPLNDFTAVITATILKSLPTLARLNAMLETWSVRLTVLRQIPGLLAAVQAARASLDSAASLTEEKHRNKRHSMIEFESTRDHLIELVNVAGSRMDSILNALEGREDSIPAIWIDTMDTLEADFATWLQMAERMALEKFFISSTLLESKKIAIENDELRLDAFEVDRCAENHAERAVCGNVGNASMTEIDSTVVFPENVDVALPISKLSTKDDREIQTNLVESVPSSLAPILATDGGCSPNGHGENDFVQPFPVSSESQQTQPGSSAQDTGLMTSSASTAAPRAEMHTEHELSDKELDDGTEEISINANDSKDHKMSHPYAALKEEVSTADSPLTKEPTSENGPSHDSTASDRGHTEPQKLSSLSSCEYSKSSETRLEPDLLATESMVQNPVIRPPQNVDTQDDETLFNAEWRASCAQIQEHSLPLSETTSPNVRELGPMVQELSGNQQVTENAASTISSTSEGVKDDSVVKSEHAGVIARDSSTIISDIRSENNPSVQHSNFETPQSINSSSNAIDDSMTKRTPQIFLKAPATAQTSSDQDFSNQYGHAMLQHPDVPVQSIESPSDDELPSQSVRKGGPRLYRNVSADVQYSRSATPFSLGELSETSDRTIREHGSSQLSSSALNDLDAYKHGIDASLPLQRFINDKSDVTYVIEHGMHSDSASSRDKTTKHRHEDAESPRFHNGESPPPNSIPRRAIRGPSSSLMRGTISSLNKAVGMSNMNGSNSFQYDGPAERVSSRQRLGSPYDADSDTTPWRRKSSTSDLLQAPRFHLHNRQSIESISSYVSSNGTIDQRRRYSFSTDGGSFAIRPVHEADSDLQEKIHSILTGIPGKIRLSNKPASGYDQQSVISSMSSSRRPRLKAQSPFSTPHRAGTPPPEGFSSSSSSSRQRRAVSHKSEDKTVKVYHLHHRGKTKPTKLFVRTVGEDGERVMVRVGGGWADLGEYLREYVLHHGRQTPSAGKVEVKGLPIPPTSPGSIALATATVIAQTSPGSSEKTSASHTRPASSLSVRKTRLAPGPSEPYPELAIDEVDSSVPQVSFPNGRRTSISSINSVSMSSILGDGASVYSPNPGSARTPLTSAGTPLGLAGPKPRTRHVSMTPENEAWVEGVVGQARRTSATTAATTTKPVSQKHLDNREVSNASRLGVHSASDFPLGVRNKRVVLRGLGTHGRS